MNEIQTFVASGSDAPRPNEPMVERDAITAVVRDPKTSAILGLRWKQVDWETLITGGVEEDQTPEDAARTEVVEETGYGNLSLVTELPRYDAKFYHHPKGENRHARFRCFLFELTDDTRNEPDPDELTKHDPVWLGEQELAAFRLPEGHRFLIDYIEENNL